MLHVDEEEDRSCSASSWSLYTNHWSLRAEEGGRVDGDDSCRINDDKNDVGARGEDNGQHRHPPRTDADGSSNRLSSI